ncbi:asparagine synthase-related protein [Octadecabacter sp. G9-8]|uniref:asparagine synthase (glutamine-hydrolyzing) n=1 Tax=Octadecabacter dasysiphoniae TaxID=2909341 RepID=A0ABS9CYI6_9RHOB|nr:asparagine synthase-related protein [Octadecabacter dasysiphoniae]MCF2872322.1 asparagine synthase-related protein [Octadecabacter dasysiphoniae]
MTVIFGGISFGSAPFDSHTLRPIEEVFRAASPDGLYRKNYGAAALGVGLRHTVPEDLFLNGPVSHTDGRFSLVGEGLIHNRMELNQILGLSDAQTATWPDAAYMVAAFGKWGEACIEHLVGEYCFAVWDASEQALTLLRHPTGHGHTLFYWMDGSKLLFSTQLNALLAAPDVPRILNEQKLADFLFLNHMDQATTHFEGVFRLPPGSALRATPRGVLEGQHRKIWNFDTKRRLTFKKNEEYVEAFNEIFNQAVVDQMRSIKPLGAMMSGGIDSSAVAVRAAAHVPTDYTLRTYTAVPQPGLEIKPRPGWYDDETPLIQEIAAMHPNIDPQFISSMGLSPDDGLTQHFENHAQPFRSASNRIWMEGIIQQAQSDGIGVLLTGQLGNMTISWEGNPVIAEWIGRGKIIAAWHGAGALGRYHNRPTRRIFGRATKAALRTMMPQQVIDILRPSRPITDTSIINPEFARKHNVLERGALMGFDPQFRPPGGGRELRQKELLNGSDFSGDVVANWHTQFGVELRDPTADLRLIEFCLAIPQEQFFLNGDFRALSQRAFNRDLPPSVLSNRQRGTQDAGWFERIKNKQEAYRDEIRRMQNAPLVREAINLKELARMIEDWPNLEDSNQRNNSFFRYQLLRGLHVARYIRWVNRENW